LLFESCEWLTRLAVNQLYLHAARLHYRLWAFFDSPTSPEYFADLNKLWESTCTFLTAAFNIHAPATAISPAIPVLEFATDYIFQMLLASGFALLKLLQSFFARHIDAEYGENMFHSTIAAIRSLSMTANDLPSRYANLMMQMWKVGSQKNLADGMRVGEVNDSLRLQVRARMSMSLIHDWIWRWRQIFNLETQGDFDRELSNANEQAMPTSAGPSAGLSPSSMATPTTYQMGASPASANPGNGLALPTVSGPGFGLAPGDVSRGQSPFPTGMETGWQTNDVFDPAAWLLDGFLQYDAALFDGTVM